MKKDTPNTPLEDALRRAYYYDERGQWREFCREDAEEVGAGDTAVQGDMLLSANADVTGAEPVGEASELT